MLNLAELREASKRVVVLRDTRYNRIGHFIVGLARHDISRARAKPRAGVAVICHQRSPLRSLWVGRIAAESGKDGLCVNGWVAKVRSCWSASHENVKRTMGKLHLQEVDAGPSILFRVVAARIILDGLAQPTLRKPLETRFVWWSPGVAEDDGSVDDKRVADLERSKIAVQGVTQKNGMRSYQGVVASDESFLDSLQCVRSGSQTLGSDTTELSQVVRHRLRRGDEFVEYNLRLQIHDGDTGKLLAILTQAHFTINSENGVLPSGRWTLGLRGLDPTFFPANIAPSSATLLINDDGSRAAKRRPRSREVARVHRLGSRCKGLLHISRELSGDVDVVRSLHV